MHRQRPWNERDDEGSAALEFILVGLILLVPLVYVILALGTIQSQTLGAESGARHLARTIATAPDAATADVRADAVIAAIAHEYGMGVDALDVVVSCIPASPCPQAGAALRVTVATRIALPLLPPMLGLDHNLAVPVEATAVQKVSRFWGER